MATTRLRDRIFAGVGAVAFLISATATTVFVFADMLKTEEKAPAICEANQKEIVLAAPEIYKAEGDVTELKTEDVKVGTGATAKVGDCLVMKYYGTLAQAGTMFDENYTKPNAFAFELGKGSVIKGWDQGLVGMKEGGTRRLIIPSELGYAEQSAGTIPANSDLVFTAELLRIKK